MKLENYLTIVSLTESLEIVMIEVSRNFDKYLNSQIADPYTG